MIQTVLCCREIFEGAAINFSMSLTVKLTRIRKYVNVLHKKNLLKSFLSLSAVDIFFICLIPNTTIPIINIFNLPL